MITQESIIVLEKENQERGKAIEPSPGGICRFFSGSDHWTKMWPHIWTKMWPLDMCILTVKG